MVSTAQCKALPDYQTICEALRTGRTFPVVPKWEIIEGKLADAMIWLWNALLAAPDQDVDVLVRPYVRSVARRLTDSLELKGVNDHPEGSSSALAACNP